jgi:hypothetical protein
MIAHPGPVAANDAVRAFEQTRRWALDAPLWRLRLRVGLLRRRAGRPAREIDQARLVAAEAVLRQRARRRR